jgi:hypothetical protein
MIYHRPVILILYLAFWAFFNILNEKIREIYHNDLAQYRCKVMADLKIIGSCSQNNFSGTKREIDYAFEKAYL